MKEIENLCDQIVKAANAVIFKGCDDISMHNLAQLRGICMSANKIKDIVEKGGDDNA